MTEEFLRLIKLEDVIQVRCNPVADIPNNPALPALMYPQVVARGTQPRRITELYEQNGWTRIWVYTLFDFHHYHYAAHEVLTVAAGTGVLQLGGEGGPYHSLTEGDVVILPAGYGHKLLESEKGFTVVGGYPDGQPDSGFNHAGEEAALDATASIAATPLPDCDPIFGGNDLLLKLWALDQEA